MIGTYPNGKPADPRTYVAAVVAVLAEYPDEIVEHVCDPVRGIARSLRFLPTIAELTDALEDEMAPLRRQWLEEKVRRETGRQHEALASPERSAEHRAEMSEKLAALRLEISDRARGIVPINRPIMDALDERIANRRAVLAAQEATA